MITQGDIQDEPLCISLQIEDNSAQIALLEIKPNVKCKNVRATVEVRGTALLVVDASAVAHELMLITFAMRSKIEEGDFTSLRKLILYSQHLRTIFILIIPDPNSCR